MLRVIVEDIFFPETMYIGVHGKGGDKGRGFKSYCVWTVSKCKQTVKLQFTSSSIFQDKCTDFEVRIFN